MPPRVTVGEMPDNPTEDETYPSLLRQIAAAPEVDLAELSPALSGDESDGPLREVLDAEPPEQVGRFRLGARLGAGGMGVVYQAHDPDLDREIAIKFLHPGRSSTRHRQRLLREAQALARFSHPNVVHVYEVGSEGSTVFIAMELIPGHTLAQWAEGRPWRAVLDACRAAGEGLAAAHDAGLVHRDYKPQNVLVGEDGRARVLDFGLARQGSDALVETTTEDAPASGGSLTRTGSLLGTPAYMAPEQLAGRGTIDARTDLFSFCVATWQLLYGQRPFAGDTIDALAEAMEAERLTPPPADGRVPRWIARALARGLRAKPAERYASMRPLLDELRRDPAANWRRSAVVVGAMGLTAVVVAATTEAWSPQTDPCAGAEEQVVGIWDETRAQTVARALDQTGVGYAVDTQAHIQVTLDGYRDGWIAMHRDACEATTVRGEQSERVMDQRMACLHRARTDLDATVQTLEQLDQTVVERVPQLLGRLPALEHCADLEALSATVAPPSDARVASAVDRLQAELALVHGAVSMGRYDEASTQLEPLETEAEALDYAPLQAAVALARGRTEEGRGHGDLAETAMQQAFRGAMNAGAFAIAADAGAGLTAVVGHELARYAEGNVWGELAIGLAQGHPAARPQRAGAWLAMARVHQDQGQLDRAAQGLARAREEAERNHGPDHPLALAARHNLGLVLFLQGRFEEAVAEHRQTKQAMRKVLGESHPSFAKLQTNLANALGSQGHYEQALAEHRLALATKRRVLGPDHPEVGASLSNIAAVLLRQGLYAQAQAELTEALRILDKAHGPEHPSLATIHTNLGAIASRMGDPQQGRSHFQSALDIRVAALGEDHREVALAHSNLAQSLLQLGQMQPAEQEMLLAIATIERTSPNHPDVAALRSTLGSIYTSQRNYDAAIEQNRAALALLTGLTTPDHPRELTIRLALGSALLARGDLDEARQELAAMVEVGSRTVGDDHERVAQARLRLTAVVWRLGNPSAARELQTAAVASAQAALDNGSDAVLGDLIAMADSVVESGHPADAIAALELAVGAADAQETKDRLADARITLAQALWAANRDRPRARALALQVADPEAGGGRHAERARTWLDTHGK